MAASTRFTTIPANFRFILPLVSAVTGVVVYASVYVYRIPSLCFILAIVGAGLQFFLGIYCCFLGAKVGTYHRFVVPTWLVVLAGIWVGPLYYFVMALNASLAVQNLVPANRRTKDHTDQLTWRSVGLGCSALNIILNLVLLVIFFVKGARSPGQRRHEQTTYDAFPGPQMGMNVSRPATGAYYYPPPVQNVAPAAEYKPARTYTTVSSAPSTASPVHYGYSTSPPPQSSLPQASELAAPVVTPYTDHTNRIEVLRRLGQLQYSDGHWEYSQELHELVSAWGGNAGDGAPVNVTAGVSALVQAIVEGVWAIQRDGREGTSLTAGERESLGGMGWDLRWAKGGADNGSAWVRARS